MKLSHTLLLAGAASMLITSCGSKENEATADLEAPAQEYKDTTPVTVDDTTKFKFDFAIANIPSPASSMQELKKWNVVYDNSVLNDPNRENKYITEYQRSVNLGIYNIDMAYAMMNNKGPDVIRYMKSILTLSDALGLKNAVSAMVGKRAESNINSKDSLFAILDEIFVKSDSYLRTNERVYTAASVFAGSWIENLYLSVTLSNQISDEAIKAAAHKHLWEQRFHLGNLINLLNDYKDKKDCAELIAVLKPVHQQITAVKQPTDMTDAKFKAISDLIVSLRNKLTS